MTQSFEESPAKITIEHFFVQRYPPPKLKINNFKGE